MRVECGLLPASRQQCRLRCGRVAGKAKPPPSLTITKAARGQTSMQSALMMSLAASIVLGVWVIWRMTP
jgi:hypothetical protein